MDIDIEAQKIKYQAELDDFTNQLQQLDRQREILVQAIHERRGILIFLNSLDQHKEKSNEKPNP